MAERKPIPVFIFTGFLDAGKTVFIQNTLEDPRFNKGEKTLLLRCEDGETEYDLSRFSAQNVFLRSVEGEEELTEEALGRLQKELLPQRVMVEFNGMWTLQEFYDAMPEEWAVAQIICFWDVSTFQVYNANMRNLVYDKLRDCDLAVFNRCEKDTDTDILHKATRQANRRCNIVYEYSDGSTEYDQKEDPLPFDVNAPVVRIEDRDFAYFFADVMENMDQYQGKTVSFTALYPQNSKPMPKGVFVGGRMLMNCCAADTQFAGFACFMGRDKQIPDKGSWMRLTGKIRIQRNRLFSGNTPVIDVISVEKGDCPEEEVATFY